MTTKQTHTPGPWRSYTVDGRWIVATTTTMAYRATGLLADDDLKADEANARLIAAAPELAAELRDNILRWSSSGVTLKDLERVGWLLEKAGVGVEL